MIPLPYKVGAALLVALGVWSAGYFQAYVEGKRQLNQLKEAIEQVSREQQEDFDQKVKKQQEITNEASAKYDAGVAAIRADYSRRLRESAASRSGEVPTLPEAPSNADAGTPDSVPATPGAATCEQTAEDAALTTYQLLELQNWVRDQGAQ